jgi:uncharacterized membrane protein
MMAAGRPHVLARYLGFTLRFGSYLAFAFVLVGLAWVSVDGGHTPGEAFVVRLSEFGCLDYLLSPVGLTNLGLVVLMFTPVTGMVVAAVALLLERDWRYFAVAVGVLIILSVSMALAA